MSVIAEKRARQASRRAAREVGERRARGVRMTHTSGTPRLAAVLPDDHAVTREEFYRLRGEEPPS